MKKTFKTLALISTLALSMTACSPKTPVTAEPEKEVVVTTVKTTVPEETTAEETTTEETTKATIRITAESTEKETIYNDDGSYSLVSYSVTGQKKTEEEYTADGAPIKTIYYSPYEEGKFLSIIRYKESGRTESIEYYNDDGILDFINLFDENNHIATSIGYNENGEASYYHTYEYDEKGNKVRLNAYTPDGKELTAYSIYEYDENGLKVSERGYDGNGNRLY